MKIFKMSNAVYDVLKDIAQIILPATAAFYVAIAKIWGLPLAVEISGTISAVDVFLGAVLKISNTQYNKENEING